MNIMNKIGVFVLFSLSLSANAGLIATDYMTDGDGKATLDDATGLEWLDESFTLGKSITEVNSMINNELSGFRWATFSEVEQLLLGVLRSDLNGSIKIDIKTSSSSVRASISNFNQLFSNYGSFGTNYFLVQNEDGTNMRHFRLEAERNYTDRYSFYSYYGVNDYPVGLDYTNGSMGHMLVSDGGTTLSSINNPLLNINNPLAPINSVVEVPEPGTIALFGLGVMGVFLRRKKWDKVK
jgi:hypothetical protein